MEGSLDAILSTLIVQIDTRSFRISVLAIHLSPSAKHVIRTRVYITIGEAKRKQKRRTGVDKERKTRKQAMCRDFYSDQGVKLWESEKEVRF